ncbi:MAG: 50S ribosomal protein L13 [Candidatus Yanofskybacteria bacterium]|nr:50S ribosomal protein L13 [Candidatus Yanofskybacteria bacterium]
MRYEIDATNQSLGRLATKIAGLLRGKNSASYDPSVISGNMVIIKQINGAKFTGSKMSQKKYHHHSGYHSGIKTRSLKELWASKPEHVLQGIVYRMLPKNKMRDKMIKNLRFE